MPKLISMFKLNTIIILIGLVFVGELQAEVDGDPLRLVLLSGRFDENWRLILSSVNDADGQYSIYPQIAVDTATAEFKIRIKSKNSLQFIGDRTRFEGGDDSLRIEIVNVDETTILIAGSLKQIAVMVSHRLSDRNMFIFDIYPHAISIGDLAGAQSILFDDTIPVDSDSTTQAHIRQLLEDISNEKIAVNVSRSTLETIFMKALIVASAIFAVLIIIRINLSILRYFKKRKSKSKTQDKQGQTTANKEDQIRALMAKEGISYDEAEIKLNVGS